MSEACARDDDPAAAELIAEPVGVLHTIGANYSGLELQPDLVADERTAMERRLTDEALRAVFGLTPATAAMPETDGPPADAG